MCQSRIMLTIEFSNNAKLRVIDKKFLDLCFKLREQAVAVFWVEENTSSKQLSALPCHIINGEIVFKVFIWIYKIIFLLFLYYFPVFFSTTNSNKIFKGISLVGMIEDFKLYCIHRALNNRADMPTRSLLLIRSWLLLLGSL